MKKGVFYRERWGDDTKGYKSFSRDTNLPGRGGHGWAKTGKKTSKNLGKTKTGGGKKNGRFYSGQDSRLIRR